MTFGAPQIVWFVLVGFNIGATLMKHGKPQPDYNIWTTLIGTAITFGLMLWGGFFG